MLQAVPATLSALYLSPQIQQLMAHIIECQHLQDSDTLQLSLWVTDHGQNKGKKHLFQYVCGNPLGAK